MLFRRKKIGSIEERLKKNRISYSSRDVERLHELYEKDKENFDEYFNFIVEISKKFRDPVSFSTMEVSPSGVSFETVLSDMTFSLLQITSSASEQYESYKKAVSESKGLLVPAIKEMIERGANWQEVIESNKKELGKLYTKAEEKGLKEIAMRDLRLVAKDEELFKKYVEVFNALDARVIPILLNFEREDGSSPAYADAHYKYHAHRIENVVKYLGLLHKYSVNISALIERMEDEKDRKAFALMMRNIMDSRGKGTVERRINHYSKFIGEVKNLYSERMLKGYNVPVGEEEEPIKKKIKEKRFTVG